MSEYRPCVLIPTYNNPDTIRSVVEQVHGYLPDVFVVDDGSDEPGRQACAALASRGLARVHHRSRNGGKGAAVKDGFRLAMAEGFSHAVQVDGDGQHALEAIPRFLALSRAEPEALILGCPQYDETLNKGRYAARMVTRFWNFIEVLGPRIKDSMCGFRVYPIAAALAAGTRGDHMEFDIEIAVRMVWRGTPVRNEPVPVRYLTAEQGGISHYRLLEDTARISLMHTWLCFEGFARLVTWPVRRLFSALLPSIPR